ncbi:hypothetical protein PINS_up018197 [Pythium insidiosum]|nr:hypothetical protein PINS_up018197 [Pythium insidiosum]
MDKEELDSFDFGIPVQTEVLAARIASTSDRYCSAHPAFDQVDQYDSSTIVVLRDAMDAFFRLADGAVIPDTCSHLLMHLGVTNPEGMVTFIAAEREKDASERITPPSFISRSLDGLYALAPGFTHGESIFKLPQEFFLQLGASYTPPHIDFGRNFAFMPRYCKTAVKVWVSIPFDKANIKIRYGPDAFMELANHPHAKVVVQRPGDVIYQSSLALHAVITGHKKSASESSRWSVIGGHMFIKKGDEYDGFIYASRATIGRRRYTDEVWRVVHSNFASLYRWGANEDHEDLFEQILTRHPCFSQGRKRSADARWERERDKQVK